jgi:hypothetical protein
MHLPATRCAQSSKGYTFATFLPAFLIPQSPFKSNIKSADKQPARLRAGIDLLAPAHFGLSASPIYVARIPAAPFAVANLEHPVFFRAGSTSHREEFLNNHFADAEETQIAHSDRAD